MPAPIGSHAPRPQTPGETRGRSRYPLPPPVVAVPTAIVLVGAIVLGSLAAWGGDGGGGAQVGAGGRSGSLATAPSANLPSLPAELATPRPTPKTTPTASPKPTATPRGTGAPSSAQTTTGIIPGGLYVSTTGSDQNPGTFFQPLRTIQRAASIARAGSTVWIRRGTYAGFEVTRNGITFAAYGREVAVITAGARDDAIQFSGVRGGGLRHLIIQGSTVQYGSGVKIKESVGVSVLSSTIRNNRTFGIVIVRSSGVRVSGNTITGNADGIEERYAGNGTVISNNRIYGNTKAVDSGRGMEGINFYKSTGTITISGNQLWNNGTHFEVYGASNLTFTGNVTWNGQIMETGTDGPPCANNRFIRNVAYRGSGFGSEPTNGMILRCASNNLVAQNTLDGFDQFAFDVVDGTTGVAYGGSIAGLRIVNNIVTGGRAFSIDSALPSSVKIDYNLLYNVGSTALYGNHLAYVKGKGQFDTLGAFTAATGYESHGIFANPRFVNRVAHDYRLTAASPAIDRGLVVLSDGYAGVRPDLGRYEYR
jgi:parallel beta-helix repeat protein